MPSEPFLAKQNIGHSIEKCVPSEPFLVEQNIGQCEGLWLVERASLIVFRSNTL